MWKIAGSISVLSFAVATLLHGDPQEEMKNLLTLDKVVDSKTWDQASNKSQELTISFDPFVWDWKKRVRIGLYFPSVEIEKWRKTTLRYDLKSDKVASISFRGAELRVTDSKGNVVREEVFGESGNEPYFYENVPFISFSVAEFPGRWWETYKVTLRIQSNLNSLGLPEHPVFLIGISSLPWL